MNEPSPQVIGLFLEEQARKRRTVYYSDIVARFGLPPMDGLWLNHPLSEIFDVLDQEDAMSNRPFRSAVVISKERNMPGNGFFEALERLRGIQTSNEQRLEAFTRELEATFGYPWKIQP
ncbi:MAG TPA: hypothetical protein P5102_09780 [Candidatus Competibacteraceae bacterium]|nr:hypothetical protein [Candidatus Competibacteraceae bacterium]HRZ06424.1 hypothetical protein [Candidatus Competibacteraceae bacterium]HSA46437.1 hypothetical protein [Candidatus Competibacteraceae bacterium]